jgi:DNA-binding transcriptional LysR family regulator
MEFHLTALRYFRETAAHSSIRKASEVLGIAPSSVHRQIQQIEKQVGTALFERSTDGVKLTAAGEVFYHYVQRSQHDLDRMLSEIDDLKGMRRGLVSVACEEGLAKDFLPPIVAAYRTTYPGVRFSVKILDMPGIVKSVAAGEFDVGVAFNPHTHAELKRLGQVTVEVGAVVLPEHPFAQRTRLRLADLVGEPLIVADSGFTIRNMLDASAASSARHLTVVVETNSFEAMTSFVKSKVGLAVRARMGIAGELRRDELVFVPISEPGFHRELIAAFTKSSRPLPVASAIFVENIVAGLAELGT